MIEMCCGRNLSVLKSQPSKLLRPQRHAALPVSPLTVARSRRCYSDLCEVDREQMPSPPLPKHLFAQRPRDTDTYCYSYWLRTVPSSSE